MKWGKSIDELLKNWKKLKENNNSKQLDETDEEKKETPWLQGSEYERI